MDAGRDRILAAALDVLQRGDFAAFSLEAVAKRAGITRMTVYNQFGSKGGLFEELFDQLVTRGAFTDMQAIFTEKDPGASDAHTSGLENVTASVVEPPVASSPVNLGGTVSTLTVRVTAGERPPALSTAWRATVWVPSASRCGACQAHDTGPASGAPSKQPWQEVPAPLKGPPSTLASTDITLPSGSLAVPW